MGSPDVIKLKVARTLEPDQELWNQIKNFGTRSRTLEPDLELLSHTLNSEIVTRTVGQNYPKKMYLYRSI